MAESLADFLTVASGEQNNWDAYQDLSSLSKRSSRTTRILIKNYICEKLFRISSTSSSLTASESEGWM